MIDRKILFGRSIKDVLIAFGPITLFLICSVYIAYKFINPAPPRHIVISTGDGEGDYQTYAKLYKDIIKEDGVDLEIRPSSGAFENLRRLQDPRSDVDVGFVQDGLGTADAYPDVSSLGSVYYEPMWVFYRGKAKISRLSQLLGKKIAVGRQGGGTQVLTTRLLKASGVTLKDAQFVEVGNQEGAKALRAGGVDAAFFIATPDDSLIDSMMRDKNLHLMNMDQAEAITRLVPFLHHLVLPHGAIDLKENIPDIDVDLVSPTATLVVRDSLHPALSYLLLKAASQVHGDPGIFERKNEFPVDKDYEFPLSNEAKTFYKSGTPFWQRYLPFWLATLIERFILLVIPMLALIIPVIKLIPRILDWRLKSRFYQRYGELKYLETQIKGDLDHKNYPSYLEKLDGIEDRVNHMKVPLDFSDHIYVLREHIHFVRERLDRALASKQK